ASTDNPLAGELERLKACFRELRRGKPWKQHVQGGVAVVECTFNAKTQKWHPHLHIVFDGKYWAQPAIATEWERVTGDSKIVDVRFVRSKDQAAGYIAKYVSKSPNA